MWSCSYYSLTSFFPSFFGFFGTLKMTLIREMLLCLSKDKLLKMLVSLLPLPSLCIMSSKLSRPYSCPKKKMKKNYGKQASKLEMLKENIWMIKQKIDNMSNTNTRHGDLICKTHNNKICQNNLQNSKLFSCKYLEILNFHYSNHLVKFL